MSQIIQLHYRRLVNLGNFENEAIELVFELAPGDSVESALDDARAFMRTHLLTPLPPPDHGAAERQLLADTATDLDPEWDALQRGPTDAEYHGLRPYDDPPQVPEQPHNVPPLDPAAPRHNNTITERQLRAIYAIGRKVDNLTAAMIDARCAAQYGCPPDELSKAEASQFIDALKGDGAEAI